MGFGGERVLEKIPSVGEVCIFSGIRHCGWSMDYYCQIYYSLSCEASHSFN